MLVIKLLKKKPREPRCEPWSHLEIQVIIKEQEHGAQLVIVQT